MVDGQTRGGGCCDGRSGRWHLSVGYGYVGQRGQSGGEGGCESRDRRGDKERRREERSKEGQRLLLRLLTVSLEDLRLLMLEAREVLMDLKEAFFLGSGSALPLFLS